MKTFALLILFMAFSGGLSYFWKGFHEMLSDSCGCMRYTYDVVVWRHYDEELVRHQLVVHSTMDATTERLLGIYLTKAHPEYIPFSIISITFVEKHSVMLRTFCRWFYRACTRSADDAVREWKKDHGLAV